MLEDMEEHIIKALKLGDLTTIKTALNSNPNEAILPVGSELGTLRPGCLSLFGRTQP
jgi:hypothetical protein